MDQTSHFLDFIKKEKLLNKKDRVLIALSGGKDSMCLLFLLNKAKKELGVTLGACHIHHGIRGDEADRDEAFCRSQCERLNIPYFAEYCNVPSFCKEKKVGLEEGARMERYRLLELVAEREGFSKIATAHTRSDQAETILFRLIRGSGFSGLEGIGLVRGRIIRPLLCLSKNEILSFLENEHIPFTEDSSNFDIYYSRNRLRQRVMPEMEQINPRVEDALLRLSSLALRQKALCDDLCREAEERYGFSAASGSVPLSALLPLYENTNRHAVLYTVLSKMASKENISISFERFDGVLALLNDPIEGKIIEISDGFVFSVQKKNLVFRKNESPAENIKYRVELKEGENKIPLLAQFLTLGPKMQGKVSNINKKLLIIQIASDKIEGGLFVRNYECGDRIVMNKMTKSVKKILCDLHIPPSLRKLIPIVCDEKEIIWIPFVGLCDKARDPESEEKITLSLSGEHLSEIQKFID